MSLHTKKTNNTNKLMQISYHSTLTKIQKLQNLEKKKKKNLYWPVCPVLAGIARNWLVWPIFFPVRNMGVICTSLLAGTVRNRLPWSYHKYISTSYLRKIIEYLWARYILFPFTWIVGFTMNLISGKLNKQVNRVEFGLG